MTRPDLPQAPARGRLAGGATVHISAPGAQTRGPDGIARGAVVLRDPAQRSRLRPDVAASARVSNAFLGGKDAFPVDRDVVQRLCEADPHWARDAAASRAVLLDLVAAAAARGVDQFVDLGCGLTTGAAGSPLAPIHTVILPIRPSARIVYVDADPMVMTHVRALLHAPAPVQIRHVRADLTSPTGLLRELRRNADLDWQRPVTVVLADVLHELSDPQARTLLAALHLVLPKGSVLLLSHRGHSEADRDARVADLLRQARLPWHPRGRDAVDTLLVGWERLAPAEGDDTGGMCTVAVSGGTR
ncbi:SAM-dependent methyltransferase [Kitasatospora sp. NPDC004240]